MLCREKEREVRGGFNSWCFVVVVVVVVAVAACSVCVELLEKCVLILKKVEAHKERASERRKKSEPLHATT